METLSLTRDRHLTVITLNRIPVLNAINNAMIDELTDALRALNADPTMRAAVLTGAGDRAFCVGMDLKERNTLSDDELAAQRPRMSAMFAAIRLCLKPLIAAVNGHALGGGLELALGCDFMIAADNALFGLPEVTRGIMPGGGSTQLLPALIGVARAREMIYTGAAINADEAQRIGLVNRVVTLNELLPTATAIAQTIAANAPIGVQQAKRAITFGQAAEAGIVFESEAYRAVLHSDDRREGYAAFTEKRKPVYQGK